MSQETSLPNYEELNVALEKSESPFQAAEVHGLVCGIICALDQKDSKLAQKLILKNKKNREANTLLQQLYALTYQQLSEFSFEFSLLLPEDEKTDINDRTENLGLWCKGFLVGLKQTSQEKENLSADALDGLKDIREISQVSYGDISSDNENENAYFELIDYVRLAVLMLYHEMK